MMVHSEIYYNEFHERKNLEVFPCFMNCSVEWMKSMKKFSSYISIYKYLVFESDHSMIMTVLLFSVWLHNVQVTICCFLGGGRDPPLLFYILNLLLISFILLPVQLSECTFISKSSDICQ